MLQHCWKSRVHAAAFGGAFGLLALAGGNATAQDTLTDNFITRTEKQIWGSVTRSLGMRGADDPVIEYRERSPLVVPPTRDLPPPQANMARANPAWPVDPDTKRAKDRADAKKKRTGGGSGFQDSDTLGNPISPSELNAPGAPAPTSRPGAFDPRDGRPLSPSELGHTGGLFNWRAFGFGTTTEEARTFTNEPTRDALTAPPPGYQTPSPAYPYGVTRRHDPLTTHTYDPAVGGYTR